ncbi:hypothetical protein DEM26_18600 [Thioclava sp. NG1]|nr:hypothetical protein B6V72_17660 [Thioclava sp. F34-6]PWE48354.1 hypothetical protein DEM26_18600 [Thioclava sp. NG1]
MHLVETELGEIVAVFGSICRQQNAGRAPDVQVMAAFRQGIFDPVCQTIQRINEADAAVFEEVTPPLLARTTTSPRNQGDLAPAF